MPAPILGNFDQRVYDFSHLGKLLSNLLPHIFPRFLLIKINNHLIFFHILAFLLAHTLASTNTLGPDSNSRFEGSKVVRTSHEEKWHSLYISYLRKVSSPRKEEPTSTTGIGPATDKEVSLDLDTQYSHTNLYPPSISI